MRFTELAGIQVRGDDDWFDPVLTEDTPLYADPFLVFEDASAHFSGAHDDVVGLFSMCRDLALAAGGSRTSAHWTKVLRLLEFKEPKEFALGLAMGTPFGSGTGEFFAADMAESHALMSAAVNRNVDYVDMFALLVPGLGVVRRLYRCALPARPPGKGPYDLCGVSGRGRIRHHATIHRRPPQGIGVESVNPARTAAAPCGADAAERHWHKLSSFDLHPTMIGYLPASTRTSACRTMTSTV